MQEKHKTGNVASLMERVRIAFGSPIFTCAAFAFAAAAAVSWALAVPAQYADLSWQRWIGSQILANHRIPTSLGPETFTANGLPWIPQEWLFSVIVAVVGIDAGFTLFAIGIGLTVAATIALVGLRTWHRTQSALMTSLAILSTTAVLIPFNSLRAEHFGWVLTALALAVVESGGWRARLLLLPLASVWANIHASVIILPVILAIDAVARIARARAIGRPEMFACALALGSLAATWINPVGFRLTTYALDMQAHTAASRYITEWQPPTLSDHVFVICFLPMLTIGFLGALKRRDVRDLLLLVAFGYLGFHASRHITLFAIVAAPIAWTMRTRDSNAISIASFRANLTPRKAVTYAAVVGVCYSLVSVATGPPAAAITNSLTQVGFYPAVRSALALPGKHRVYCEDFTWCSLIVGTPRFHVWWDGRADPYPLPIWDDARRVAADMPRGIAIREFNRYGVDVAISRTIAPLSLALRKANWQIVSVDAQYVVWQRRDCYAPRVVTLTRTEREESSILSPYSRHNSGLHVNSSMIECRAISRR